MAPSARYSVEDDIVLLGSTSGREDVSGRLHKELAIAARSIAYGPAVLTAYESVQGAEQWLLYQELNFNNGIYSAMSARLDGACSCWQMTYFDLGKDRIKSEDQELGVDAFPLDLTDLAQIAGTGEPVFRRSDLADGSNFYLTISSPSGVDIIAYYGLYQDENLNDDTRANIRVPFEMVRKGLLKYFDLKELHK